MFLNNGFVYPTPKTESGSCQFGLDAQRVNSVSKKLTLILSIGWSQSLFFLFFCYWGKNMKPQNIKLWNMITKIGRGFPIITAMLRDWCRPQQPTRAQNLRKRPFYVFPNQKQNWKLSFVFCLRVVISMGNNYVVFAAKSRLPIRDSPSIYTVYLSLGL